MNPDTAPGLAQRANLVHHRDHGSALRYQDQARDILERRRQTTHFLAQMAQRGDRWELRDPTAHLAKGSLELDPSWDVLLAPDEEVVLEGSEGQEVTARYRSEQHQLVGKAMGGLVLSNGEGMWFLELVSAQPPRFRLLFEESATPTLEPELTSERGVRIAFSPGDMALLERPAVSPSVFDLSRRAADFGISHGFEQLISLPLLRDVKLYEHQLKTVRTVLRRFRGRALLCDEVGLGKTIEAGMILLELLARKLVRRVLILTPPSLVAQWQGEMRHKFGLEFITHDDPAFKQEGPEAWCSFERIVASFHTAKRQPHRDAITGEPWDMVIVDEAHHMRNRDTLLWKFASSLNKKYILLLTATPLQNNLEELYNLVTLLQPGLLSTARRFRQRFVARGDKLTPRNLDHLQGLLAEAMVRNRRSTVGVRFTRRYARTFVVTPLPPEQALYREVTDFVRERLRTKAMLSRMALITLQKEMGSCSLAAAPTLERIAQGAKRSARDANLLRQMAVQANAQVESAKAERLLELLREFPDKVVIFTQFRATQEYLHDLLSQAGENVALFHGGLSRMRKEQAIRAFQGQARVLLSTDSGSEGRNLQFCHAVCNFDLPWNPMRIEQRIGRLSRIGQTEDVYVFNFVSASTLEADLLHLLEAKINLFELVMGEMDMILGNLHEKREFEDMVLELWVEADDEDDFHKRMEALGDRMAAAKEAYLRQRELDERLFGEHFIPEG